MAQTYVYVMDDVHSVAHKAAETFLNICLDATRKKGYFVAGVSGGSTPRPMYHMLCSEPYINEIPWGQVHIFWVDERIIPYDSEFSNYGNAKNDFLDLVPIPARNIHPILVDRDPEASASIYEQEIMDFFALPPDHCPVFDALFLGLGEDGHVASLFPSRNEQAPSQALVISVQGGNPSLPRVTMTPRLINNSKEIIFLVTGNQKAGAVKDVLEGHNLSLPSAKIVPTRGRLIWIMDREAASGLKPPYPRGHLRLVKS